jgi:filamentous hemagglutinin family protein
VVYSPPSCGLPKGHDRQRDPPRHGSALEFEIEAFNLPGQPMADGIRSYRFGPPLLVAFLAAAPVQAQIVTDGTVGPKVSLRGGEIEIGADLGTRRGDNLFHSFEKFGIATGQSATFTGPGAIKNVISRVTGGEVSNIDGKLASRVGQADLYFLNPAGVMFGPNATLDVPGSLHVSTAHELRFADGARFSALDKTGSGLTVASPEAFGFLDRPPGRIAVDQSQLYLLPGKTLSLVGGDINISGRTQPPIMAENGMVNLTAIATGEVQTTNGAVTRGQLGTVLLTQKDQGIPKHAVIDVRGDGGGGIRIQSDKVLVVNTLILADNLGDQKGTGRIEIRADTILIRQSRMTADTFGAGNAGTITIDAGNLELHAGGLIRTATFSDGNAGSIDIRTGRLLTTSDGSTLVTGISSSAQAGSTGAGGSVTVTAGELQVRNSSEVRSSTFGRGPAGTVTIYADKLLVSGDGAVFLTGIVSTANRVSSGAGGNVTITAGDLQVRNGGEIGSSTFASGNAGTVTIQADRLFVSGDGSPWFTGIRSSAEAGSTGQAGILTVTARELELQDGGEIGTRTAGSGDAGLVKVNADHLIAHSNGSPFVTGITSDTTRGSTGHAGSVAVTARELELLTGGFISTGTSGLGNAGQVTVNATRLLVSGTDAAGNPSAISSAAEAGSTGAGGAVNVQARSILLQDQGVISTQSFGTGPGGLLTVTATDTLQLDNAAIQTKTETANGGDLVLAVGRLFDQHDSTVTTSVAGGTGSGGNIIIDPPLMVLNNSRIEANAQRGAGGNITIRAGQLIRTPNSVIQASSAQSVSGTITVTAPNTDVAGSLVVLPGTLFDVSSELREACAARGGRPASSFNAGGRGGLPPDPGAPLAANSFGQSPGQQAATGSPAPSSRPTQAVKPITVSGIPQPVLGSPRLTCRG